VDHQLMAITLSKL